MSLIKVRGLDAGLNEKREMTTGRMPKNQVNLTDKSNQ